ncbi:MAG: hypothetical protein KatS3mg077_1709 [Candidatus Binatia bacterium]|nr:MAG: hypothetical protein KatS3mg077_1709 [Candidatus Binatia bacterium]
MNRMWAPAAVRVANDGTVYVADSQAGGSFDPGRILVFEPPLSSGMAATRLLGSGFRLPTGLEFDLSGGLWASDRLNHQLLLLGLDGTIQKVLFKDVPDMGGRCGGNYSGDGPDFYSPGDGFWVSSYNLCDSMGSIGIDADGNVIVTASMFAQDAWRFPAPIPTPRVGTAHSADARLFPPFQIATHNEPSLEEMYSARGVAVARGQLIVADGYRRLFWNNPPSFMNGQAPDGFAGVTSAQHWRANASPLGRIRAGDGGHLWVIRDNRLLVYSLPLTQGAKPVQVLAPPIAALGGGEIELARIEGVAPVGRGEQIWVADSWGHRVVRIRNPLTNPVMDVVLGQRSLGGKQCNHGRGPGSPSRDSLCFPGSVSLDPSGNLWVSDHGLEVAGNHRMLVFHASSIPERPARAAFGLPADRVLGTAGNFSGPSCVGPDGICGPFEAAFTWQGQMALGMNSYIGSRFVLLYPDPLGTPVPTPLRDFESMPYAATFDRNGNLYVASLNRSRVLVYLNPLSIPTAPPPTATPTPHPACSEFAPDNPCVPGGGKARSDCHIEWKFPFVPALNRRGIPRNAVKCYEGDPRCDADPDLGNGSCTFSVSLCINCSDARLGQCIPSDIAAFEVRSPNPLSSLDAVDRANVQALEEQAGASGFGVRIVRRRTPLPTPAAPNASPNSCGGLAQLVVPLRAKPSGGLASGRKRFRIRAWTSGGIMDSDTLRLVCRPSTCGDGRRQRHEQCDDGNRTNGDGCDQACRLEEP